MIGEALFGIMALLSVIALLYTIREIASMLPAVTRAGAIRIVFRSLVSLKLFVVMVLLYFAINTFMPEALGPVGNDIRMTIRLLLSVYATVQPLFTAIAISRWKRTWAYRVEVFICKTFIQLKERIQETWDLIFKKG